MSDQLANQQQDMARQQLGNLGGLAQAATAAPRPPTNIEEAIQKCHRLIENNSGIITRNSQFIDRVNGPRPEKDQCGPESDGVVCGQLSELHRLLDILDTQVREMANQIDTIDGTL